MKGYSYHNDLGPSRYRDTQQLNSYLDIKTAFLSVFIGDNQRFNLHQTSIASIRVSNTVVRWNETYLIETE